MTEPVRATSPWLKVIHQRATVNPTATRAPSALPGCTAEEGSGSTTPYWWKFSRCPTQPSTDGPSHTHRFAPQPWGQQGKVLGWSDYTLTCHSYDSKTHRTKATNMTALLMITSSQRLTKFRYLLTQSWSSFLARSPTKAYQSAAEEENGRVTAKEPQQPPLNVWINMKRPEAMSVYPYSPLLGLAPLLSNHFSQATPSSGDY